MTTKEQMHKDMMNRAILRAQQTQLQSDGDHRHTPTVSELRSLAENHFREITAAATEEYLRTCNNVGGMAVIDKLSAMGDERYEVERYFGGQVLGFEDQPPVHLGSRMMSYQLQKSQDNTCRASEAPADASQTKRSTSSAQALYSRDWNHKELTIGNLQTEGMEDLVRDSLEDMGALEVLLLLNKLANPRYPRDILITAALRPRTFDMDVDRESEVETTFKPIAYAAAILLEVLQPAFTFITKSCDVIGGRANIAVAVAALDQHSRRVWDYQAMIELMKPSIALRAANILAFGGPPTAEDFEALRETIGPMRDEKLEHSAEQLEQFATMLPVKRIARQDGTQLVFGYAYDDEDITEQLREGYFEVPLDSALSSLEKISSYASRNRCRNMAISDGFTFIATHLRDLEELQRGLVTANFNSHAAVDLTEDRSALRVLLYLINAVFRDSRVRHFVGILLEAAAEHFGNSDITPERAVSFRALMGKLDDYQFHSDSYPEDTDLDESGKIFTKSMVSVIQRALAHFKQAYGSSAQSGEYESSNIEILENFRVNALQGIPYGEDPIPGRSRSVSKVIFHGISNVSHDFDDSPRSCVLKIYDADAASIGRMERELEAYSRLAQLKGVDQKRIAKLLAFGALDLEGMDPRLFIAIEYVEECHAGEPPFHTRQYDMDEDEIEKCENERYEIEEHEIDKVCDLFKSVGVYHNDFEERNFKWQFEDGEWFLKVFDFDHATFDNFKPTCPSGITEGSQSLDKK